MATAVLDSLVETVSRLPEQDARTVLDFARSLLARIATSPAEQDETFVWEHDPLWDIVGLGASDDAVEHDHPHIERVATRSGQRAMIRGTRVAVSHIVGYIRLGETPESIADEVLPFLTRSQVDDALVYYDDHWAEIDRELAENTESASMIRLRERLGDQDFYRLAGRAA